MDFLNQIISKTKMKQLLENLNWGKKILQNALFALDIHSARYIIISAIRNTIQYKAWIYRLV
ncbi:hypothetical protein HMPREF3189_00393 [Clostridiales bacterium KA00134]|nr:hypothetical protein HMPREF3189_00393 [Clostridiales bacterium KA00134]